MQSVISNLDGVDLHLEYLVLNQIGVQSLPFVGMDSKYRWIFVRTLPLIFDKNLELKYATCTNEDNVWEVIIVHSDMSSLINSEFKALKGTANSKNFQQSNIL